MQPPSDPPANRQRWVSFAEAQKILGLTEGTLRRAIKAGSVQAERRHRNPDSPTDQRMVYEVLVSDAPGAAATVATPIESAQSPEPATIALPLITSLSEQLAESHRAALALTERAIRAETLLSAAERRIADLEEAEREHRPWWKWWGR